MLFISYFSLFGIGHSIVTLRTEKQKAIKKRGEIHKKNKRQAAKPESKRAKTKQPVQTREAQGTQAGTQAEIQAEHEEQNRTGKQM